VVCYTTMETENPLTRQYSMKTELSSQRKYVRGTWVPHKYVVAGTFCARLRPIYIGRNMN